MPSAPYDLTISAARAGALFPSPLQSRSPCRPRGCGRCRVRLLVRSPPARTGRRGCGRGSCAASYWRICAPTQGSSSLRTRSRGCWVAAVTAVRSGNGSRSWRPTDRSSRYARSLTDAPTNPECDAETVAPPPVRTRRLSAASIRRIHCTLRKALNDAVRKRILDYNPAIHAELDPAEPPRPVLDQRESRTVLDAIVDPPLYALYHLAAYRGLRRGELVALRWCDVDPDEGFLEVRRNIVQLGSQTVEGTPKSEESHGSSPSRCLPRKDALKVMK
jgi:integrase